MEVDLRKNGRMSIEQAKEISALEPEVRIEYNYFIGKLIKENNLNGLELLLQATCRNTNLSFILDRFCKVRLLEKIIKSGEVINKVIVDSICMKSVCERLFEKNNTKTIIELKGDRVGKHFRIINNSIKSLYMMLCFFLIPKMIGGKETPNKPIIYLENFLFIDSFDKNGKLNDRYYPGLIDSLDDKALEDKIWYAPTLIGIKTIGQYFSIFKMIRSSKTRFLMKEDWLELKDYFSAFNVSLGLLKKINKIPVWSGLDVNEIVKEELCKEKGSPSLVNAILLYNFIRQLKENNVEIDIVIDWNENQVIDRAINLAINKYFPDVYVRGYQGYVVPNYYACKDPTCFEVESRSVPDEISVVGEAFVEDKKKYCPALNVSVAPAFRFSNVHNPEYLNCKKDNTILIVLPISLEDSREILKICARLISVVGDKYNFYVKHHPSFSKDRFISLVPEILNSRFKIFDENLYEHLCKSVLLVSALSSVCLEAAVLGVSVAIIGTRAGPVMNPLDGLEGVQSWKICYDENEIAGLLKNNFYAKLKNIEYFFQPVTVKSAREFVTPSNKDSGKHNAI